MDRWILLLYKTCAFCLLYKEKWDKKIFLQGFDGSAFGLGGCDEGHDFWYSNIVCQERMQVFLGQSGLLQYPLWGQVTQTIT